MLLLRIAVLLLSFLASAGCSSHHEPSSSIVSESPKQDCPTFLEGRSTLTLSGYGALRIAEGSYLYREILKPDWKLVEIDITPSPEVEESRVVFYFGGGPRVAPASMDVVNLLRRTYNDGHTRLVIIAHTGNELPNMNGNARLEAYGMRSVLCDAKVASEYIRNSLDGQNRSIVIHGNSYGTVLALAVASELTELRDLKLILQAPWFFPLSLKAIVDNKSSFFSTTDDGIKLSDRSSYEADIEHLYTSLLRMSVDMSGVSDGERTLSKILQVGCESVHVPIFAMIGSLEDRSDIQSTKMYFDCFAGSTEVAVSIGAPHGSELAVESTRVKLQNFLSRK